MQLYIVRHGKAEQDSSTGRDRDRELAPKGQRQARWLGEQLAGRPDAPTTIYASPFARADQTARMINESIGAELLYDDRLIVDEPASGLFDLIGEHGAGEAIALVGHNPQLSRVAGTLAREPYFEMKTGMCAIFQITDPQNPRTSATLLDVLRMG